MSVTAKIINGETQEKMSCQAFLKMSRKTLSISPDLSGLLRFYEPYASNDETIDSINPYLMFDRLEGRLRRDTYLCP